MKTSRNSTQKMRASVQNGIDDKIHNDGIDHGEIELTTCLNGQDEKAKYQNMKEKAEKMSFRPKIVANPKGIKLNKAPRGMTDKIHVSEKDDNEIELTTSEQWERVNDLSLLITTILIFNATALIIAFFQITWKAEGTVFNKALVLKSQKTIGMSIL